MCTVQRNFFMAKLSFFLFAINFPQRPRTVFRIAIDGNFQRLSPSLSAGKRGYTSRKEHTCVELKRPFTRLLMKYCVQRRLQKKPTNRE